MAVEVLVTGGDTELGRTVAEGFRDDGHKVTLVGARRSDLEIVAKELDVDAIVCDTTDPASLTEARGLFPTIWTPSSTCRRPPVTPATHAPTPSPTPPTRGVKRWTPPCCRRC